MPKQRLIWVGLVLVAVAIVLGASVRLWREKNEAIKIGAVLAMSGPAGYAGEDLRDAMLMAIEETNAWGGVNGKKLELIIQDSKGTPQEGRRAFEKIEQDYHPLVFISHTSTVSMAVADLAEKNRVPVIGVVVMAPEFTRVNDWVFRFYATSEQEIPPALFTLRKLKVKDLGILYMDDEYGRSIYELLKAVFITETAGTVKAENFKAVEIDFRRQIAALKSAEAIYVIGFATDMAKIFKQLRQENFSGFILASHTAGWYPIKRMPEANRIYISTPKIFDPNFFFAREFKDKYEARYKKPLSAYAASGYDFIKFLAGLLEEEGEGGICRQCVASLLKEDLIYSGIFGKMDIKPREQEINFPLFPAQIIDGEIRYLESD